MGTLTFPLSQQIESTVEVHGIEWAEWFYCHNPKGPRLAGWEWAIFTRGL